MNPKNNSKIGIIWSSLVYLLKSSYILTLGALARNFCGNYRFRPCSTTLVGSRFKTRPSFEYPYCKMQIFRCGFLQNTHGSLSFRISKKNYNFNNGLIYKSKFWSVSELLHHPLLPFPIIKFKKSTIDLRTVRQFIVLQSYCFLASHISYRIYILF